MVRFNPRRGVPVAAISLLMSKQTTAKVRRYESPDEHPFTPRRELPAPLLPALEYPDLLRQPHEINVNSKIMRFYTQDIVPALTKEADDSNYGSSATRDIEVLQAMSRRIHYGAWLVRVQTQLHANRQ